MARIDALARHQRLLLLQGPNGPFFRHLYQRLRLLGAEVTKVNFCAGDDLYFPRQSALCFRQSPEHWSEFLRHLLRSRRIEAIVLFGQDRPLHVQAIQVAQALGVEVVVFEEGYIRPCWITMEYGGVNGKSVLMRPADAEQQDLPPAPEKQVGDFPLAFAAMASYSAFYFLWGALFRWRYPHYAHHKPMNAAEAGRWLRCYWRKGLYRLAQRHVLKRLATPSEPPYFLVPLQMAADSQIKHNSPWPSIEAFVEAVIESFARHAPGTDSLVFKHHPMEVGHAHYGATIRRAAQRTGVHERVLYVHDGHLPSLLQACRGVVVVNSTVGLQAMHHGTPVMASGRAIYAHLGLVHQGDLDSFWRQPRPPNPEFLAKFLRRVLSKTQVNASFYAPQGHWSKSELSATPLPDSRSLPAPVAETDRSMRAPLPMQPAPLSPPAAASNPGSAALSAVDREQKALA